MRAPLALQYFVVLLVAATVEVFAILGLGYLIATLIPY